jgi:Ca2+-binding RTX toxin-like protein
MNIGGLLAPSRPSRRTIAIVTVAFLVAGFMVLGTRPAWALTACELDAGVLTITTIDADTVTIARNLAGTFILSSATNPGGDVPCSGGTPRTTNVTSVVYDAAPGLPAANMTGQELIIDMTNGHFVTPDGDEIHFDVDLGPEDPAISSDTLRLIGRTSADVITAGASGIDLTGDGDVDLEIRSDGTDPSHEDLILEASGGDDMLSAGGGGDMGAAHTVGTTFVLGGGNHTIVGGTGTDVLDYSGAPAPVTVDFPAGTATVHTNPPRNDTISAVENVVGSGFDDTVISGADANRFAGGAGIDTISYAASPVGVEVELGANSPTVGNGTGSFGFAEGDNPRGDVENIIGSPGHDVLTGNGLANRIDGTAGNDEINGGSGNDVLIGGAGIDTISGGNGSDLIRPGSGTDFATGHGEATPDPSATDTIDFSDSSVGITYDLAIVSPSDQDTGNGIKETEDFHNVIGSPFNDSLKGDAGDNVIVGGLGNDTIEGRDGTDTSDYSNAPSGVTVDLAAAAPQATGGHGNDTLATVEDVIGTAFADVLRGDASGNSLTGGAGDDVIEGRGGNDTLAGGDGNDTLEYRSAAAAVTVSLASQSSMFPIMTGGAGNDTVTGFENLVGSAHNDTLTGNDGDNILEGLAGNDTINGGGGSDTASYRSASSGVNVDLQRTAPQATGGAGNDTLSAIENITGSAHNDVFRGTTTANVFTGLGGTDTVTYSEREEDLVLRASGAAVSGEEDEGDTIAPDVENLVGGEGDDLLAGASGVNNHLNGGPGTDAADYGASPNAVAADLTAGKVIGASTDTLTSIENLFGSNHSDTLIGNNGPNELRGQGGNDFIDGRGGNDTLRGGTGNDTFYEGTAANGADLINGDLGFDTVDYSDRTTSIAATFEGTANDGAPGEGDNLISIESVLRPGPAPVGPVGFGYWLVASDGGIFAFGDAGFHGSTGALTLNQPIVGMTPTPSGNGYWFVASDGGIFAFGDAPFHGSMGGTPLNQPIVGMEVTPSGAGYWLVASDGGIFAFGDAPFHGSTGAITLNQPIVGMTSTSSGDGYWFVASDGGIFAFGDAGFAGSMGGTPLNQPIVGMDATPSGAGYWLVASDGGIFAFGDAPFHGSTGAITLNQPIVGMTRTATGSGYWFVASDGGIFAFGDAGFAGSMGGTPLNQPIVGMASLS